MRRLMLIALTFLATLAIAQDALHVTAVEDHIRSKDEPSFSTALHTKRITGIIGDKRYHLEEAAMFAYHFEVGKDYPVVKATDKEVKVRVTDKKGRESTETLQVKAIEEVQK
jgi:hypothetical protein